LNILQKLHRVLCSLGINLLLISNIRYIHIFIRDYFEFKKLSHIDHILPMLGDHKEKSSKVIKHYFNQDLLVASYIFKNNPKKHVDVGSRVDGFVAHVASFRKIEVIDIRNNNFQFKNIIFKKKDINNIDKSLINYCDSISCLHTLEHFGLGRYGDKIDPEGHIIGFKNLLKILKKNGRLYISFPISNENKIYFNSERSFHPEEILKWSNNLELLKFDLIDDNDKIFHDINLKKIKKKLNYSCGIYVFKKK
jgi:hypothetical protein